MRRSLFQGFSIALLLVVAGSAPVSAMDTDEAGVASCKISAWSTDKDPDGLNIRAAPGTDSPIIGKIPPPTLLEGDPFAAEVRITGSKDGWFRIGIAYFTDYYWHKKDQVYFEGEGWVSGRYLGLSIEGRHLYRDPSHTAPVVADLYKEIERGGPDFFVIERLHACRGYWLEVEGTFFGARLRGWTRDTCASQVTTCP